MLQELKEKYLHSRIVVFNLFFFYHLKIRYSDNQWVRHLGNYRVEVFVSNNQIFVED